MKNGLKKTIAAVVAVTTLASYMYAPLSGTGEFLDITQLFEQDLITAADSDQIYEGFTYSVSGDSVTITKYTGKNSEITIPDTIDNKSVTAINEYAFQNLSGITAVTLPKSLKSIGYHAFSNTSVKKITIPASVTSIYSSFANCESLTDIVFAEGCTTIPERAFEDCPALTSVKIPSSVVSVMDYAFLKCTALASVSLPDTLKSIGYHAFSNTSISSINIPASLTSIHSSFANCKKLTDVVFAEGCTTIPGRAFEECPALTSVKIPSGIVSVQDYAFLSCTALASVSLPDTLKSIGYHAFSNTPIKTINIPASLTSIHSSFANCKSFTDVVFAEGCTTIPERAFEECPALTSVKIPAGVVSVQDYAFLSCTALASVSLPDTLKSIGYHAFSNTPIKTITIPTSVTSIHSSFANCKSFTDIVFAEGRTTIPERAFEECPALTSISIPEGIVSIQDYAFLSCTALTSVSFPSTLKSLGYHAFSNTSIKSVTIPNTLTSMNEPFANCKSLTDAVFAEGFTEVPEKAFKECAGLKTVTLPDTISKIGSSSFSTCSNLEKINSTRTEFSFQYSSFMNCTKLRDQRFRRIVLNASSISAAAGENDMVNYTVKYKLTDEVAKNSKNYSVVITLPFEITLNTDSISCDNSTYKVTSNDPLTLTLSSTEGTIKFSARAPKVGNFPITAKMKFSYNSDTWTETIGTINAVVSKTSDVTTTPAVTTAAPVSQSATAPVTTTTPVSQSATASVTTTTPVSQSATAPVTTTTPVSQPTVATTTAATTPSDPTTKKLGDVNGDGKLTTTDARMILQYAVGLIEFTDEQKKLADVNKDGKISTTDASRLLRFVVGVIDEL